MRVDVSIDELVLVGFDPRRRLRVADELEREIAARLDRSTVAALRARDCDSCDIAAPEARVAGRPDAGMATVAASIVQGLSRGSAR